jgi:hypothetical protein
MVNLQFQIAHKMVDIVSNLLSVDLWLVLFFKVLSQSIQLCHHQNLITNVNHLVHGVVMFNTGEMSLLIFIQKHEKVLHKHYYA